MVGIFWSIFFIEGIRVIMITNWHFDIFRPNHWQHLLNLWQSGWVIDEPKEWAFILIIFTAIPVWLTVFAALSIVHWKKFFAVLSLIPIKLFNLLFEKQVKKITNTASVKVVKKKKSYKEIRPKSVRPPLEDSSFSQKSVFDADRHAMLSGIPAPKKAPASNPIQPSKPEAPKEFTHSLFEFDDDNAIDFDLFAEPTTPEPEKETAKEPKPQTPTKNNNNQQQNKKNRPDNNNNKPKRNNVNSSFEIIKQKGYEVITGATIQNTFIDFIGIAQNQICLCLNDKEPGDWLADEERFNDEEPLWFSESSHRISPVRKVDLARISLEEKLKEAEMSFEITPYVIIQIGNIINTEDMLDIWKDMNVNVTRIDRGTPKELPLFAKTLEDAEAPVDKAVVEKIKKILRSIA